MGGYFLHAAGIGNDMGKNILVFMDGTRTSLPTGAFARTATSGRLYRAAAKRHDGNEETVLYVRGVGTMRDEAVEAPADDLRLSRIREWNPPSGPAKRLVAAPSRRWGAQVRRLRLPIFDDLYRAADGLREHWLPQNVRKGDDLASRIGRPSVDFNRVSPFRS